MLAVLFLIIIISIIIILWCKWKKMLNSSSAPILSQCYLIIGHTHRIVGDTQKLWKVIADISMETIAAGDVTRMFIGMQTYYLITGPDDLAIVGNSCVQKHFAFDFPKHWLGDGLITAAAPIWKRHRKLLNPAFTLRIIHGFLGIFNVQARELVLNLDQEVGRGAVDLSNHFRINAVRVLSRTVLGISDTNDNLFEKYAKAADKIMELYVLRFQNMWLHSDTVYRLVGLKKKETSLIKDVNDFSNTVIEQKRMLMAGGKRKGSMTSSGLQYKAFLDLLLEYDDILTDKEIREEVDTIIVAGYDTSSWTMNYVCAAIGTYPEVQKKLVEELVQIFGKSDRDVEKDDLQKMVYTEAVIKETLRLYTLGPVSLRTVETGVQLKNYYLKPGDHVIMSFYGVNRHPIWGPDVAEFRPERWLQNEDLSHAFAGFGMGKRSCIGKAFAMMSMKVSLAHVLRRYILESADITKMVLKMDFIAKPTSGYLMAVRER